MIDLTPLKVINKEVPDFKVVIVPLQKAEGYNLTTLGAMISSVYPSNQATREQIEGRLNRFGNEHTKIDFVTVSCGILNIIKEKHNEAKNLSEALKSLSDIIKKKL
jgi:hypothetical protein